MVHADAASLPSFIQTKSDLYDHLESTLTSLIQSGTDWVSALSNASSVIYHSLNRFSAWEGKKVNWAGFYLLSGMMPSQAASQTKRTTPTLLLGPFVGLPACQLILSVPGKGVCADASALLPPRVVRVADTEAYPGHIACDSLSRSEIVVPLILPRSRLSPHHRAALESQSPQHASSPPQTDDQSWAGRGTDDRVIIGVLDIDCEALEGFDHEDEVRLQKLANLIVERAAW
ncbi:hypothetical protein ACQY0O_001926 [Thecaphora frezii]